MGKKSSTYSEQEYWEGRYHESDNPFEWYMGYDALEPFLKEHIDLHARVLQVGIGTSMLQLDMAKAGYTSLLGLDYSQSAVAQMLVAHEALPGVSYRVADCRDLSEWADGSFDTVIDKGTLDSALCGEDAVDNANRMLAECLRVLSPGGLFMLITYGVPAFRLMYLMQPALDWHVRMMTISKPDSSEGDSHMEFGNLRDPADAEAVKELNKERECHFAYLCWKHPDASSSKSDSEETATVIPARQT